jgi:hypothetical protein
MASQCMRVCVYGISVYEGMCACYLSACMCGILLYESMYVCMRVCVYALSLYEGMYVCVILLTRMQGGYVYM